jgi:hypothetical protein
VLVDDVQQAGTYRVTVDRNAFATQASGVYFYHLQAGDVSMTMKMILLK